MPHKEITTVREIRLYLINICASFWDSSPTESHTAFTIPHKNTTKIKVTNTTTIEFTSPITRDSMSIILPNLAKTTIGAKNPNVLKKYFIYYCS